MKVHRAGQKTVVAVCDEDILGKEFREGNLVLKVDSHFYGGKLVGIEEVVNAILSADIAVITGTKIVEELSRRGLVLREFALRVGDQLHVQIVKEVQGT